MSIRGYVNSSIERGKWIIENPGLSTIILLEFIPKRLRQKALVKKITKAIKYENKIVRINKIRFVLVDRESFDIVSPKFEKEIQGYVRARQGQIAVDIGAHIGKYSFSLSREVGKEGLVISSEPDTKNYLSLIRGIRLNKFNNVIPIDKAFWSENTELNFYKGDSGGHGSLKADFGLGKTKVEAIKLDSLVSEMKLRRVDLIKIDAEGSEYEILEGSKETLLKFKPRIICEIGYENYEKTMKFLKDLSYKINIILEDGKSYYIHAT